MKNFALIFAVGLLFAILQTSGAAAATKGKKLQSRVGARLQTDVRFDSSVVHGRYQTPEEAVARVENEKVLSDLLAVRKHFKDRLQVASGQE